MTAESERADGVLVLVVEDEEDIRALVSIVLVARVGGHVDIVEADTAEDGINQWRARRPDAVVLDNRLPGMSGLDAAALMLADDPALPVVLFTAVPDEATVVQARKIGVLDVIGKDELSRLVEVVSSLQA